jgi:hypothetical protein
MNTDGTDADVDATRTIIEVMPRTNRQPSGFGHLRLFHRGCERVPLMAHRNPLKDEYRVQCTCGLQLRMPAHGSAVDTFIAVANDGEPRTAPGGSYASSVGGVLDVVAGSTA